jgi:hypothetical protein
VEFLVISLFHESEIPTVGMKVHVSSNFSKIKLKKNEISMLHEEWMISPSLLYRSPFFPPYLLLFFPNFPNFWALWSTLPHWLQPMPAKPRLLLKTSNIHNFWSIGPEIMKFVLTQSLLQDASSQKVPKNLKIKWGQVTLPKTGLATLGTFGTLGVKSTCWDPSP